MNRLLSASAQRAPEHVAVRDGARSINYGELDRRSNRLANLLSAGGTAPRDRVALYLDKSIESLVAIYAVLKAGATYVPFDPHAPPARLAYMASDAGTRVVLTSSAKAAQSDDLLVDARGVESLVVLDAEAAAVAQPAHAVRLLGNSDIDAAPDTAPDIAQSPDDLAYILYTSGSTGEPKGVMLSHANALAFVDWAVGEFAVRADDRLSSHAPLHFDLSVFDLFAAAHAGATLVLVPQTTAMFPARLKQFIDAEGLTVWYSVPSALTLLLTRGGVTHGAFPALRTILFAGEVFPMKYLVRLMELLPHVRFANLYGPTETNVCTWYEVPRYPPGDAPAAIPIGKPIAGVDAFPVDDAGRRVSRGEVGELYVRGPTVMHGYWGDAERSARTLFQENGSHVYRTGDLVQEADDGNFLFLGRRDAQIKSRGYRIELGDIEAALYDHPAVVECAAIAVPDDVVTNRIKAVLVTREPTEEVALVEHCRTRLPRYMIPELFEFRDELPKSSTGKIARKLLQPQADA